MRTLILSDLHLGGVSRSDLLRRAELREPLLRAVEDVERVVLLGDVLELRHGPPRDALAAARPFFEDLGRVLAGKELILVAGNHDHALIEPWLSLRATLTAEPAPLGLEQLLEPAEVSPIVERLAGWAAPATVRFAYPGLWLRPDVYATHGHYLDCHLTVPTIERLSVGVMTRLLGKPASSFKKVDDYETVTAPVYAWRDAVARDAPPGNSINGIATANAWHALNGGGRGRLRRRNGTAALRGSLLRVLRAAALIRAFPVAVAALNRAGIGPLRPDVSSRELRVAGLRAMGQVASQLGLDDAYVVFGHTHRAGPLPGDDEHEWNRSPAAGGMAAGVRLVNTGCWSYDPIFLTEIPGESPYWPGTCVLLEDSGPPTLKRLLLERTHAELAPARQAAAGA